jgi:hypothetical protein
MILGSGSSEVLADYTQVGVTALFNLHPTMTRALLNLVCILRKGL